MMLTQNLISGISDIMEDGGLPPLLSASLFPSLSLCLLLSAIPIKACTFVPPEFDSIISPPGRQLGTSCVMEILHVCRSSNAGGSGICGPVNCPRIAIYPLARPYAEATCRSQLRCRGDLGPIEHKMTSNWPLEGTAPR